MDQVNFGPDIRVTRPTLTVDQRCQNYLYNPRSNQGLVKTVAIWARGYCQCSLQRVWAWVSTRMFILTWLPRYHVRQEIFGDIIAGITVGIMHLPQGMAYAVMAGLPPVTGLYMAFFPVLMYVLMGTSHHVSMGTVAVTCLMMVKVVEEFSSDSPATTAVPIESNLTLDKLNLTQLTLAPNSSANATTYTPQQVAAVLALIVGLWEIVLGLVQLGEVFSMFLSTMLVSGFTTGVAIHVLTSQLKSLFGVSVPRRNGIFKIIYTFVDITKQLPSANIAVVITSAICIVILVLNNEVIKPWLKKYTKIPMPMELLVVVLGTVVSYYGNLQQNFNVKVVGDIPTGLPPAAPPPVELLSEIVIDGFIIGVVGYTSTLSMSKIFAQRHGYTVDATQELYAQGVSNVFGSFFLCGPMAASLSRSLIQEAVGGTSLLTALISCCLILLILLFIGPLFEMLPHCVLSAIIIVALKGLLLQYRDFLALWKVSKVDALIWISTFAACLFLDLDYGLLVGVVVSLLVLLAGSQFPPTAILGHVSNTDLYLNTARYDMAKEDSGIHIFQFAGPLHFANSAYFKSQFFLKTKLNLPALAASLKNQENKPLKDDEKWVILDLTITPYVDSTGAKLISQLQKDLQEAKIRFALAAASDKVLERLEACGTLETVSRECIFHSVHDAVTIIHRHETTQC